MQGWHKCFETLVLWRRMLRHAPIQGVATTSQRQCKSTASLRCWKVGDPQRQFLFSVGAFGSSGSKFECFFDNVLCKGIGLVIVFIRLSAVEHIVWRVISSNFNLKKNDDDPIPNECNVSRFFRELQTRWDHQWCSQFLQSKAVTSWWLPRQAVVRLQRFWLPRCMGRSGNWWSWVAEIVGENWENCKTLI